MKKIWHGACLASIQMKVARQLKRSRAAKLLFLVSLIAVAALFVFPARAESLPGLLSVKSAETSLERFEANPFKLRRTGRPACWVEAEVDGLENRFLCFSRPLWKQLLLNSSSASLSGAWMGRWRVSAPLRNSDHDPEKRIRYRFSAKMPGTGSGRELTLLEKAQHGIEWLREKASVRLEPHDPFGILRKLVLNEDMPERASDIMFLLGFIHVFTATGIHLYALASFSNRLVFLLTRKLGASARTGWLIAMVTAFAWFIWAWLLSGMRPGMLRPFIVVALRMLAEAFGIKWRIFSPLLLALAVDVVAGLAPAGFSAGAFARWHYAIAVGGGLLGRELFARKPGIVGMLREHLGLALGSWLPVALWDAWKTHLVALATPFLSVVTIPILATVVYPMALLGVFFGGLLPLAGWLSYWPIQILVLGTMEWNTLWQVSQWGILVGAFVASLFHVFRVFGGRSRGRSTCAVLVLVAASGWHLVSLPGGVSGWLSGGNTRALEQTSAFGNSQLVRAYRVEQLDVGQGDAALVLLRKPDGKFSAGLVDTGPKEALNDSAWIKLLAERGLDRLEWIALTHLDSDHASGALRLARVIPIGCVVTSGAELESVRGMEFARKMAVLGIHVREWASGCFPFPHWGQEEAPAHSRNHGKTRKARNEKMSAVWIPFDTGGFYLSAGDADFGAEVPLSGWVKQLERERGEDGPRVLKVSHHGSRHTTSSEFLEAIAPTEAWISVGVGNRFGHPGARVLELLAKHGIPVRRTDREGVLATKRGHPSAKSE